jgi:HPt (histidine-containing phosphotransfer) domain-containing protein
MVTTPGTVDTTNILTVCRTGAEVDEALLREMLGYFVDENRRRLNEADAAVNASDRESLRQTAHAIRGSAAMLGAGHMHDLAASIEHNALADDLDLMRAAVATLRVEFIAVLAALRARHPEACA